MYNSLQQLSLIYTLDFKVVLTQSFANPQEAKMGKKR